MSTGREDDVVPAPIPRTFMEFVRSMGPGVIVVLTWLGAGDIVDASVAGADYGYALMWVLALALGIRWLFVSTIARYQLLNQHGESVMEGLKRLHPAFMPFVGFSTILLCHSVNVYMYQGLGDSCKALAQMAGAPMEGGPSWFWAVLWAVITAVLLARSAFKGIEILFLVFLGLLSVSLLGAAAMAKPDVVAILKGTLLFQMPDARGAFKPEVIAVSIVGAVAGSLANLMYPYLMREKGWVLPEHRRVQQYDLALGIVVIVLLDLAVWALGAQVLHPQGLRVESVKDLASMLTQSLGSAGGILIYLGVFAAVASSIVGNAMAYSYMATHALLLWKGEGAHANYRSHPWYRWLVAWGIWSPLVWVIASSPSFVALTVLVNAVQIILLPVLAGGIWALTARSKFIGAAHKNSLPVNVGMALFMAVALAGTWGVLRSLLEKLGAGPG